MNCDPHGPHGSPRSRCAWRVVVALLVATALPRIAVASCEEVAALAQRGASVSQIAGLTGLTPGEIGKCLGTQPFVASPVGPPPIGAAGPPPLGAAGPPPIGAAGPAPHGAAGPPPIGAAGPAPHGAAGASPFGTEH